MSFNYAGGKARLAPEILSYFPPHEVYIEAFGGAGNLLFLKKPSKLEIWNDLDDGLSSIFLCLKIPELQKEFYHLLTLTPPSRFEFDFLQQYSPIDVVQKAYRTMHLLYFSFMALRTHYKPVKLKQKSLHSIPFKKLDTWIQILQTRNICIENLDYRKLLDTYLRDQTVVYCDPPFEKGDEYRYNFSDKEQDMFFTTMLSLFGKSDTNTFFISYNDNKEVRELFSSYYIKELDVNYTVSVNTANPNTCKKTELLISNKPFREHHIYNSQSESLGDFFMTPEEALV